MSRVTEFGEASTFTRGRIVSVDDGARGQLLTVEGYRGERFSEVLRDQPHGFSSVPPAGSVGWFERVGSSDRLRAIGYEAGHRPVGSPGGSAVLYDAAGSVVFAKMGEGVKVRAVQGGVEVEALTGTVTLKRGAMQVILSQDRVDLGGPDGFRVVTEAGPSTKVFAIL